jgi:hypothetical protein
MCSHFANSGERSAVTVQLIGITNNLAVLLQVRPYINNITITKAWCLHAFEVQFSSSNYDENQVMNKPACS